MINIPRPATVIVFLILLLVSSACSNGSPMEPSKSDDGDFKGPGIIEGEPLPAEPIEKYGGSRGWDYLWGYKEYLVNEEHNRFQEIPLKTANFHLNARVFLEESPCSNCIKLLSVGPAPGGLLTADVEIVHPFIGAKRYTGFDVRLIFIVDGSYSFPASGLITSDPDNGEASLINADGYTTLFNTQDFAPGSHGQPIFEYSQGKQASQGTFTSTLNGFKRYKSDTVRNHFPAGGNETQSLLIKPPAGAFRMGYAVNASWAPPNPNPPVNVPDDFPINANCVEPWDVTAYLVENGIVGNGYAQLKIEIRDWQGVDTVGDVKVEAFDLHGGLKTATLSNQSANWAEYELNLSNEKNAPPGEYRVLIIADSIDPDPNLGPVSAYQVITVRVIENPLEPVWPMFRHDARHTGKSKFTGPRTNNVAWKYWTSNQYALHSSPTIGHDGTVFIGGDDKDYYALNPDGSLKWRWDVGESWIDSSSCIDANGTLYIVIDGHSQSYGTAFSFDENMNINWQYQITGWTESSPIIAADGTIVFGSRDDYIYAMNDDGTLKWKYKTGNDVRSSPAMDPFGVIYIGSNDKKLYAFDSDGNVLWTFLSTGPIFSSPCIDSQNRIYFGTLNNKVFCIDQDGNEVWQYPTGGQHISSPGLDEENGVLYIGSDDHYLYAINLDGTLRWKFLTTGVIRTSPAIDAEGYVYIRDRGPGWKVFCIDPDGNEVWQLSTESEYNYELSSSPTISDDGSLYIGCMGYAYCIRDL